MRLSCISFLKEEKRRFFKQFTLCISDVQKHNRNPRICDWQDVSFLPRMI